MFSMYVNILNETSNMAGSTCYLIIDLVVLVSVIVGIRAWFYFVFSKRDLDLSQDLAWLKVAYVAIILCVKAGVSFQDIRHVILTYICFFSFLLSCLQVKRSFRLHQSGAKNFTFVLYH